MLFKAVVELFFMRQSVNDQITCLPLYSHEYHAGTTTLSFFFPYLKRRLALETENSLFLLIRLSNLIQ